MEVTPEELEPLKVSRRKFFFLSSLAALGAALPGKLWVPPPPTVYPVSAGFGTADAWPLLKEIVMPEVRSYLNHTPVILQYLEKGIHAH